MLCDTFKHTTRYAVSIQTEDLQAELARERAGKKLEQILIPDCTKSKKICKQYILSILMMEGVTVKILRNVDLVINVSPAEIADCFCDLHDDEQALFFNRIAEVVKKWDSSFASQLQYVIKNRVLTDDGMRIMRLMGGTKNK